MQRLMHLCLQPKAQKQLQQLRLERMGPLDHPHAIQSSTTAGFGSLTSTSASTASALSNSDSLAQEDSLAASRTTQRLPTKAELRGTLGTVNRKVHMATVHCQALGTIKGSKRQHLHMTKGCASFASGILHLFLSLSGIQAKNSMTSLPHGPYLALGIICIYACPISQVVLAQNVCTCTKLHACTCVCL